MSGSGGKQKPFTLEERKIIEKMIKQGKTGADIGRAINRSKTGTNFEIRNHGGRANYTASKAVSMAQDAQRIRIDKIRAVARNPKKTCNSKRVEALEMQVNILNETIKGLLNR